MIIVHSTVTRNKREPAGNLCSSPPLVEAYVGGHINGTSGGVMIS